MNRLVTHLLVTAAVLAAITGKAGVAAQTESREGFSGPALFDTYCATCHGRRGTGDGPLSALLRKPPANLTLLAKRNGGTFSAEMVARIIDGRSPLSGHGGGDMPVWGDAFDRSADGASATHAKITALVNYLQSIQQTPTP